MTSLLLSPLRCRTTLAGDKPEMSGPDMCGLTGSILIVAKRATSKLHTQSRTQAQSVTG